MKNNKKGSGSTHEIPSLSEHQIQCAVIDYCAVKGYPVFAIPNGGDRHVAVAVKLKKEGVRPGVPDLFFPEARDGYHGLFLEMKTPKGKLSEHQKFWCHILEQAGYLVRVGFGIDSAIKIVDNYFTSERS